MAASDEVQAEDPWQTAGKLDWEEYVKNELEAPSGSEAELEMRQNLPQYDFFISWESPEGETGEEYLMSTRMDGYIVEIKPDAADYFG